MTVMSNQSATGGLVAVLTTTRFRHQKQLINRRRKFRPENL
jgi:hypothetical protein